jgi:hypothetical protein
VQTTGPIPADASASEMQDALNALVNIGTVTVSRSDVSTGYEWLVTYDGCKVVSGVDICTEGPLNLLVVNAYPNSAVTCVGPTASAQPLSISRVTAGSGPAVCSTGLCVDYVTDLSGSAPYSYLLSQLSAGVPYYVQVSAHNREGFGYPAITDPEFQVPTFNPPGAPPPVRMVSSDVTPVPQITLAWDPPRENGGADVAGYELWMDDWAGGNPLLVYDGTSEPTKTSSLQSSVRTVCSCS